MLKLYTIYDRVAEEGSPPFLSRTDGQAVRLYLNTIKDLNATDYWLYCIGTFDNETMLVNGLPNPKRVKVSDGLNEENELKFEVDDEQAS